MSDGDSGGRWGKTPFKPEELKKIYGTNKADTRLNITCPACEKDWYPVATCCVKSGPRCASPFCPDCGVDFRLNDDEISSVKRLDIDIKTNKAGGWVRKVVNSMPFVEVIDERIIHKEKND